MASKKPKAKAGAIETDPAERLKTWRLFECPLKDWAGEEWSTPFNVVQHALQDIHELTKIAITHLNCFEDHDEAQQRATVLEVVNGIASRTLAVFEK